LIGRHRVAKVALDRKAAEVSVGPLAKTSYSHSVTATSPLGEGGAPDVITDYYGPALAKLPDGTFHHVGIFERSEDMYPNRREKMAPLEDITIV
jgi:hypothetical protein